ncbi:MAG: NAD-dependent succinate-semialdehyde dehydrogenase [Nannocystaceae bacterium]
MLSRPRTEAFIGGRWTAARGDARFPVYDPATDELVALVADCGAEETTAAVDVAAAALPEWRALTGRERAHFVRALGERMRAEQERLARLMTLEQGKPLSEARDEVRYAADFFEWSAVEGQRINGELLAASTNSKRMLVLRQPVGVTAAITPWNFPLAMIARKLGPALSSGCVQVVKPAEQTPLCALALAELAEEVGLPAGVFSVITARDPVPIGEALTRDVRVRKLSFTGSTEVGRHLMHLAAGNIMRISLELGGHAPVLVFDDADLEIAARGVIASKFRNAGQTCISANRVYCQAGIYDAFVSSLVEQMGALRLGNGADEGVHMGPLIDDAAVGRVEAHVADARARGARVRACGDVATAPGTCLRLYAPTLLEDLQPEMLVMQEETFGPVLPVLAFRDEVDAIKRANDTPYGLAAYFFTRDASRIWRVAEALEYGIIGVNDGAPSAAQAPFGGYKQSGLGREGGRYAFDEYLETKYVSWGL